MSWPCEEELESVTCGLSDPHLTHREHPPPNASTASTASGLCLVDDSPVMSGTSFLSLPLPAGLALCCCPCHDLEDRTGPDVAAGRPRGASPHLVQLAASQGQSSRPVCAAQSFLGGGSASLASVLASCVFSLLPASECRSCPDHPCRSRTPNAFPRSEFHKLRFTGSSVHARVGGFDLWKGPKRHFNVALIRQRRAGTLLARETGG